MPEYRTFKRKRNERKEKKYTGTISPVEFPRKRQNAEKQATVKNQDQFPGWKGTHVQGEMSRTAQSTPL